MRRLLIICVGIVFAVVVAVITARVRADEPAECALAAEAERPLDLQKREDVEHLEVDLLHVRAIADRYREYVRTIPLHSQSIDARTTIGTRPDRAHRYCVAILTDQVAATHHLDAEQLRSTVSR